MTMAARELLIGREGYVGVDPSFYIGLPHDTDIAEQREIGELEKARDLLAWNGMSQTVVFAGEDRSPPISISVYDEREFSKIARSRSTVRPLGSCGRQVREYRKQPYRNLLDDRPRASHVDPPAVREANFLEYVDGIQHILGKAVVLFNYLEERIAHDRIYRVHLERQPAVL